MASSESMTTLVASERDDEHVPLCSRCAELGLSVDKFIISTPSTTLIQGSRHYKPGVFELKSGGVWEDFAHLRQLRAQREVCRFCELLCATIERYSHGNATDSITCSLNWEVYGRQFEAGKEGRYVNSTRRLRVRWHEQDGPAQEVYLVLAARKDPEQTNSDAHIRWNREMHFLGREFEDHSEKQALIKSWLDLCVTEHGHTCQDTHSSESDFLKLIDDTYFGVIDVVDMQLKQLPVIDGVPEPYVALSYVWGLQPDGQPPYRTMRGNVVRHISHGGLETAWEQLPRTIQDAILLVSRLGQRYIWIDSICIVQDSQSSWQLNARAMHLVYGNAYFTICAADGIASDSLRAMAPILRSQRSEEPLKGAMANMSLSRVQNAPKEDKSHAISASLGPGVRVLVVRPLEAVVNDSKWNQRAWTFQERILSRRCLVFAEGHVYFQCRSMAVSQNVYTDGKGSGWSPDRTNSPLRTRKELQQRPIWFYMKYVGMYTGRNLTKPGDILAAFEGISWLLDRYLQAPSLFGIPTSHFDLALLWTPSAELKRRGPSIHDASSAASTPERLENENFGDSEFPSWSWAGWMGETQYEPTMVDGCLVDVRSWLTYHTWIRWHIRDEKGHIKPVWKVIRRGISSKVREDLDNSEDEDDELLGDEHKWKGYPGMDKDKVEIQSVDHSQSERNTSFFNTSPPRRNRSKSISNTLYNAMQKAVGREISSSSENSDDSDNTTASSQEASRGEKRNTKASTKRIPSQAAYQYGHNPVVRVKAVDNDQRPSSPEEEGFFARVSNTRYLSQRSRSTAVTYGRPVQVIIDPPGTRPRSERSSSSSSSQSATYEDEYGRLVPVSIPKESNKFLSILPDHPFGVIYESYAPKDTKAQYMPILQFFTWRAYLHVAIRRTSVGSASQDLGSGLRQCDIVDKAGDWCGSIRLPDSWIRSRDKGLFCFIAISDAKSFTNEECPIWTYYIPKERDESEWDLYFVLLLERNNERGVWERAGLGKVFQAAFRDKTWEEIKLG